jgi:hypothetical protein
LSIIGERTGLKLTGEGVHVASKAGSTRGSIGQHYYEAVATRVESGAKAGQAIKEVASAEGTTASNVSNAYYRVKRQVGSNGAASSTRTRAATAPATAKVPKDLEPILDAIRKDRQSLSNNIDQLIAWGQAQEAKTRDAVADAREAAIRQIREAAAGLK